MSRGSGEQTRRKGRASRSYGACGDPGLCRHGAQWKGRLPEYLAASERQEGNTRYCELTSLVFRHPELPEDTQKQNLTTLGMGRVFHSKKVCTPEKFKK